MERTDSGPYREVRWQRDDLRELEYASVLHDFGKIGIREHVLVKAKKLFPHELGLIRQRFDFVIRSLELNVVERKTRAMNQRAPSPALDSLDHELAEKRAEIEAAWQVIEHANEPSLLAAGHFQRIEALGR